MKSNMIIMAIILVVAGGGAGFFGGVKYQQGKQPAFTRQFGINANGQQGNRGRMGGQVVGEILSLDDKSITIKLADNSSKIVLFSSSTIINKAAEGTKDDLKTGERVAVFGTGNTDGSVTAQNIQLNPMLRGATNSATQR